MANWQGTARSNYFRVKNEDAFRTWVERTPPLVYFTHAADDHLFAIGSETGWPVTAYNQAEDEEIEIDLPMELSLHLAEDQIAILMETGAEGLRYVTGFAVAVNERGEQVSLHLAEIYQRAIDRFGIEPTRAEW